MTDTGFYNGNDTNAVTLIESTSMNSLNGNSQSDYVASTRKPANQDDINSIDMGNGAQISINNLSDAEEITTIDISAASSIVSTNGNKYEVADYANNSSIEFPQDEQDKKHLSTQTKITNESGPAANYQVQIVASNSPFTPGSTPPSSAVVQESDVISLNPGQSTEVQFSWDLTQYNNRKYVYLAISSSKASGGSPVTDSSEDRHGGTFDTATAIYAPPVISGIKGRVHTSNDIDMLKFTAQSTSPHTLVNTYTSTVRMAIYSTAYGITLIDDKVMSPGTSFQFGSTAGEEYYIKIYDYWGVGNYEFAFSQSNLGWQISYIKANNVWNISQGEGISVAVLDNDFQLDHEGLIENMRASEYLEYVTVAYPATSHGTHVSGIIAAQMNNTKIIGVAPKAKILPISCVSNLIGGVNIPESIAYAKEKGCKIVNMSFSQHYDWGTEEAIRNSPEMLFVAAAGNDSKAEAAYPAAYNSTNIISVANMQQDGWLNSSSNHTKNVHIAAPGTNIYSSIGNNSYGYKTGTSMAAPCVSGVAALISSKYNMLSGNDLKQIILNSATSSNLIGSKVSCGGYLNAETAMSYANIYQQTLPLKLNSEQTAVSTKLGDKSKVNLDNYIYNTNKMYIQFKDNNEYEAVIDQIEKTLNISINVLKYQDLIDSYYVELDEKLTKEIVANILDFEQVTFAASELTKVNY